MTAFDRSEVTWEGPKADDPGILDRCPPELVRLLAELNGFLLHEGGLHVRGASLDAWHGLRRVWEGEHALHTLYATVRESDVPFAEDAVGDQFLLRDGSVMHLYGETGEMEEEFPSLADFLTAVAEMPIDTLQLAPLIQFHDEMDTGLEPGQLLNVWPPFCTQEAEQGVSLAAVDALERRAFLAEFSRQIASMSEGDQLEVDWS